MNTKALCALALLGSIVGVGAQNRTASPMVEWPYVAGDQGAMRYSPLTDLNADTVKRLELAWQWKAPTARCRSSARRRATSPARR